MKVLTAVLALMVIVSTSLGQGTVTFQNSVVFQTVDPTGGGRLIYDFGPLDPATGLRLAGTQWVAELYAGADASSLQPLSLSISRFRSTTSQNKGKWAVTGIYGPNDSVVLPGFLPGQTAILQVKVWNFDLGASFESTIGGHGQSLTFSYRVPAATDAPAVFYMEGFQAFAFNAFVPEPSTVAIGLIGLSSLIILVPGRRQRAP